MRTPVRNEVLALGDAPIDKPPQLDQGEVPFERPRRFARTRSLVRRVIRKREKRPSEAAIAVFVTLYFGGALGVCYFDRTFLLSAWLMAGPLTVAVYSTYEERGRLLNPYVLFYVAIIAACVASHFIGVDDWLDQSWINAQKQGSRSTG